MGEIMCEIKMKSILVVAESDDVWRHIVCHELRKDAHEVTFKSSGPELFDVIKREVFNIVICGAQSKPGPVFFEAMKKTHVVNILVSDKAMRMENVEEMANLGVHVITSEMIIAHLRCQEIIS
jgi:CheY-like chemotaxis protein